MDWVGSDHPRTKYKSLLSQYGADLENTQPLKIWFITLQQIRVPVIEENVLKSGIVSNQDKI